ncbi:uncharacterized protein LOC109615610 [Esox lucius]|uniref:DUF4806 domain-containing protein n=1 Tax=Esox lucius TaxID=8010 RepID=A0AAY5L619_ESOLU|nr:uncharacterized protein LOC109615610 [Esox lucius]
MLPFAVVDFLHGGGVAILPCKWFTGPEEDTCYWPPGRLNISKAVKDEILPNPTWPQFKVRVLGKAGTYAHATEKLLKAEATSDLQTESDSGRRMGKGNRKRKPVCLSSSDEELGGAGHDHPSSVPSPQPIPENLQPQAPHSLKTRPFIQPPSIPLMTVASEHPSRVLQGASSAFRDAMFARLLTVLEEIKETQRVHGRMIQSLLTQRDASAVTALPEDVVFPLRTVSDVAAMEQKLADPTFHKQVVGVVAEIGGRSLDEATRRMMAFLFDHTLSREYILLAAMESKSFGGSNCLRLYMERNALTNHITRRDAEKAVSKWLIGARDRGGNRTARARGGEQDGAAGRATTED